MSLKFSLSFSLIFHLLLILFIYFVPKNWLPSKDYYKSSLSIEKANPLSIELVEKSDSQQIVRHSLVPENQLDSTSLEKARFSSATDQRVLLETKAKFSGQTANNFSTPKYQQEVLSKKLTEIQKELKHLKEIKNQEDFIEVKNLSHKPKSDYKPLELYPHDQYGVSTLGEDLPDDISVGNFTALNTDQFQFYTFYSRIEDLVRFRWESKVREAISQLNRYQVLKNISKNEWVTQIEFMLNEKGVLVKALILNESGIPRFDQAAIWAFENAKVFPNPPKEMLRSDGLIHLRYSFHVNYSPTYIAQ